MKVAFEKLKAKMKILKNEVLALFLAYKRPDVSWYAKLVAIIVVGYALSPIDLIPDFIPILGYIDDLILLPLGIAIAIKLIPKDIMDECREQAKDIFKDGKPQNRIAAVIIVIIWLVIIGTIIYKIFNIYFGGSNHVFY